MLARPILRPRLLGGRGYAATREDAMMAFKLAWDTMPTDDAEALLAWAKRNILGAQGI
jgi:hypothetical protein